MASFDGQDRAYERTERSVTMMSMIKAASRWSVGVVAGLGLLAAGGAEARSTTNRPASIVVWPKIVVDSSGNWFGVPTDTKLMLSSTNASGIKQAHCFYINATGHCSNDGSPCRDAGDCDVAECVPSWSETDFDVVLTQEQPLAWYASDGLSRGQFPIEGPFRCNAPFNNLQCFTDAQCPNNVGCNSGQSNLGSAIPPAPEDPFIGALVCIQFTGGSNSEPDQTATRNRLYGDATIVRQAPTSVVVDPARYNAIGLEASGNTVSDGQLVLSDGGNYASCPGVLILSHLFDGAVDPILGNPAVQYGTELTLVPCSNDFLTQTPGRSVAQFLVFNEFEQRFSTSRTVDCLFDSQLSRIDTRNPARSIFSAGVAGSLAGQTRIRGVGGSAPLGSGLLGVARANLTGLTPPSSAAYDLHQMGNGRQDVIVLP
ncbi:MAG: hypothetical protein KatS3mg077_1786 [Candidatus Binatia bacterium]|nr:MAG: hypothetical protein KatS3mg077_1786 [Candidatus Binatia bacterium]